MANPLSWFRKHQKVMLVFFGVILMAVFGLGSVITQFGGSGSGSRVDPEVANKVVAKWRGGEIKRADLDRAKRMHFAAVDLVAGIDTMRQQEQGTNYTPEVILIDRIEAFLQEDMDRQLVYRLLAAEKAKEMGIVVTTQMVDDYLNKVAPEPLTNLDLESINEEMNQGRVPLRFVKEHLKIELLAQQFSNLYIPEVSQPSPSEAFDFYNKLNDRIECQVRTFKTSDFVSKVSQTPTDKELRDLFAQGRYEYPDPLNIKPGFKKYPAITLAYFEGDREVFIQNEMQKLKPEEVIKEYDRLVTNKDPLVIEQVPDKISPPEIDSPDDNGKTDGDASDNQGNENGNGNQPSPPPGNSKSGDEEKQKSSNDQKDNSNKVEDKSKKDSTDKAKDDSTKKKDDQFSSNPERNETLASLSPSESRTYRQDENKSNDSKQGDNKKGDDNKGNDKQGEPPVTNPPINENTGNGDNGSQDVVPPVIPPIGNQDDKPKQTRTKPFAEVEDAIKRSLVTKIADDRLQKAFDEAEDELLGYKAGYDHYKNTEGEEEPDPLDFQKLAKELKLKYSTTDPMDQLNYNSNPIGKIQRLQQAGGQINFVPFGQMLLSAFENINLYEPMRVSDFSSGTFVTWAIEKNEAQVLEFDEAREKVLEFWKFKKAQELAKAAAEEFAQEVNSKQRPMLEINADATIPTGSFTWLSSMPSQLQQRPNVSFSRVIGTTDIGPQFMKNVFGLDKLEAVATNNEKFEEYYTVQLISKTEVESEKKMTNYLDMVNRGGGALPPDINLATNLYFNLYLQDYQEEFFDNLELVWLAY